MGTPNLENKIEKEKEIPQTPKTGEITFNIEEFDELEFSHRLAVNYRLGEGKRRESEVLWIDSINGFNPYKISKIAKSRKHDPYQLLKGIYISRAFTCYQAISTINKLIPDRLKGRYIKLIILTGLPYVFADSDLLKRDAINAIIGIFEKLGELKRNGKAILLSSKMLEKESKIREEIIERSDKLLRSEKEANLKTEGRRGSLKIKNKAEGQYGGSRNKTLDQYIN